MTKTFEQLQAQIAELQAALKTEKDANPIRVQPSGNVSVYPPGRKFPVTMSARHWLYVLGQGDKIREALGNTAASKVA
jgi:hypothetical protein